LSASFFLSFYFVYLCGEKRIIKEHLQ